MTAQQIINRVREKIKDDIKPYRISDADMFDWINDGVRHVRIRRPDYLVQTDGTLSSVTDVTAVGDSISLPEHFKEALACFVTYQSYISEDADRHNSSQANEMRSRFETLIQTI